ncbi:cohesin domain-containing protein [Paenibacillus sp. HB172176]|uniref:cohesin domain-containing protein n=1 Tax=Paenibacillus sp. HB172176 TaxID=2493690 RepID=UPI00143A4139|nr:cohesin domain-containing protein [Paenibacillus sp. HB172176]
MVLPNKRMLLVRCSMIVFAVLLLIPFLPPHAAMADEPTVNECDAIQTAWLFCDDFEQDRLSSYYLQNKPSTFGLATDGGIDGSASMLAQFQGSYSRPGNLGFAFGKTPDNATYLPAGDPDEVVQEFYWRFYVKNDEDWSVGTNGELAKLYAYGPDDLVIAQISIDVSSGDVSTSYRTAAFDGNGVPTGIQGSGLTVTEYPLLRLEDNSEWNAVEAHVKLNDPGQSNGVYELWANERVIFRQDNIDWFGSYEDYGFNAVQISNYNSATDTPLQYRNYDNMVLSREKVAPAIPEAVHPSDPPQVLFEDDFENYTDVPMNHGWRGISDIEVDQTGGVDGSHAAKVPITGQGNHYLARTISRDNVSQVYVKFDFRMDNPSGGSKFLKLFGKQIQPASTYGYANTTFGLDYWEDVLKTLSYGNGSSIGNDTATIIDYNGTHSDPDVVVETSSGPFDPKDGEWHTYEAFMKYNSNGNRDGEYMILIDGVPTLHATNVKNRNDLNSNEFRAVSFADYTSDQYNGTPWNLWYDNVVIMDDAPASVREKFETYVNPTELIINECSVAQPDWIFCDDFQENRLDQYYDYFNRWGRFGIQNTGMEASRAMTSYYGHYDGDPVTDPSGTWLKLAFGKTPDEEAYIPAGDPDEIHRDLYWRFYLRNNTEATGDTPINNGPLAQVYGYGPGDTPFMRININYPDADGILNSELYTGQFDGSGNPTGAVLSDTLEGTTPIMHPDSAGDWHRIEVHAKLNDPGVANGVYELSIDGELESSKTGIDWVGSYENYGINAVEIYNTNNQIGVPGGDNEYHAFDNMVLSRSAIGEAGQVVTNNANLKSLNPTVGKLVPAFNSAVTEYELKLEDGVATSDLTPVLSDALAAMTVDGAAHGDNVAYTVSGSQTSIVVTAQDGTTVKTYTVNVVHEEPFFVDECASPKSAWLFCDDFESDRMDQYFEHTSPSQFYRTSDVGLGGSSGMKAEFQAEDGEQHDTGALKLAYGRTPSAYLDPVAAEDEDLTEVYARFYVKNQEDWTGGGGDKMARISSMQDANWAQSMIAHVWSAADTNRLAAAPASGTDAAGVLQSTMWNDFDNLRWFNGGATDTPMFDAGHVGEWYAVEAHVKLNDPGQSNGVYELWIDDQLEVGIYDLNWIGSYEIGPNAGYGLNWFSLENYWNAGTPQDQERYFDNLVLSREKIGLAVASEEEPVEVTGSGVIHGSGGSLSPGGNADLTIGVVDPSDGFTTLQAVVEYDPAKLEFDTEGTALAESAIESLRANFNVIGTAIKPELGQILVLMASDGAANAVDETDDLFRLHGKVKSDAAVGSTTVSLSQFDVSTNGTIAEFDISQASDDLSIVIVTEADKDALTAAIAAAQAQYSLAPEGTKLGQYPASARSALQAAIGSAQSVNSDAGASQSQVDQAAVDLNAAVQTLKNSIITLVEGATKLSIADLSIIASYLGVTSSDASWSDIEAADVLNNGMIDIQTLAAIAQMILDDWLQQ